jgi:hypothetical protein
MYTTNLETDRRIDASTHVSALFFDSMTLREQ